MSCITLTGVYPRWGVVVKKKLLSLMAEKIEWNDCDLAMNGVLFVHILCTCIIFVSKKSGLLEPENTSLCTIKSGLITFHSDKETRACFSNLLLKS